MSPTLAAAIYAARELAWEPTHNLSNRERYAARNAKHDALIDALGRTSGLSANASAELRFLLEAMHRVAACSFANRRGEPYYERKVCVAELRGCLLAYDRSRELVA